jgi:rRNA maturation RNase YbeY
MILNRQRTVRVARPPLEAFLARVREQLRLNGAEITVCLVSDPAIAHMNETYRHKKGPTDVLSFPSDEPKQGFVGASLQGAQARSQRRRVRAQDPCAPGPHDRSVKTSRVRTALLRSNRSGRGRQGTALPPEPHSLGDIAISPATARRNAKKFGRTLPDELQILILHGVLHLLGYDHETDNGQMTRVENRLRRKLGLQ